MAANKSFKHQIYAVQDFEMSPDAERYQVVRFDVAEAGNHLVVRREMQHLLHSNLVQVDIVSIGQKGAVKTIHSALRS